MEKHLKGRDSHPNEDGSDAEMIVWEVAVE